MRRFCIALVMLSTPVIVIGVGYLTRDTFREWIVHNPVWSLSAFIVVALLWTAATYFVISDPEVSRDR